MALNPHFLEYNANSARVLKIDWELYLKAQIISQKEFKIISAYDSCGAKARFNLVQELKQELGEAFLNALGPISKEDTIKHILVLIDDAIDEENNAVVDLFGSNGLEVEKQLLRFLNSSGSFIRNMSARLLAKIVCWSNRRMSGDDLYYFLSWLNENLLRKDDYIYSITNCLRLMVRNEEYRDPFLSLNGVQTILVVIESFNNYQLHYNLIYCIWILSFSPIFLDKMTKYNVVPVLASIFCDSDKEKVTRIILGVFRNYVEKTQCQQVVKEHCIALVQQRVLKQLTLLEQRSFTDEDILEDIKFLTSKLQSSLQDMSSFSVYVAELRRGQLEWSPAHRSAQFWRENATKLNEKRYEILRILLHLIQNSKEPLTLAVAAFDIGEYVRYYSGGKAVVESLGGKQLLMGLLSHSDQNVRYEALVALQKMMVQNWTFLTTQVERLSMIQTVPDLA